MNLKRDYLKGTTLKELASDYKMDRKTVRVRLLQMGVYKPKPRELVQILKSHGIKQDKIASLLGLGLKYVYQVPNIPKAVVSLIGKPLPTGPIWTVSTNHVFCEIGDFTLGLPIVADPSPEHFSVWSINEVD